MAWNVPQQLYSIRFHQNAQKSTTSQFTSQFTDVRNSSLTFKLLDLQSRGLATRSNLTTAHGIKKILIKYKIWNKIIAIRLM